MATRGYGLRVRTFSMASLKRSSFGDALQLLAPALAAQRLNSTRRTACVTAEHSAAFRVRAPARAWPGKTFTIAERSPEKRGSTRQQVQ